MGIALLYSRTCIAPETPAAPTASARSMYSPGRVMDTSTNVTVEYRDPPSSRPVTLPATVPLP
jgi:hypothetical protein